jgi:hypothetical protein
MALGQIGDTNGVLSLWPFEGNSTDSGHFAHNGTDSSIVYSQGNGRFGQGAGFNGASSKITLAESAGLNLTDNFSVSCWIKSTTNGGYIFSNEYVQTGIDGQGFWCSISSGFRFAGWALGSGSSTFGTIGSISITDGKWHHCLGTFNTTSGTVIYTDGVSCAFDPRTVGPGYKAGMKPTFGAEFDYNGSTYGGFLTGSLDEFVIYNRVLSPKEVRDLYNWSLGRRTLAI